MIRMNKNRKESQSEFEEVAFFVPPWPGLTAVYKAGIAVSSFDFAAGSSEVMQKVLSALQTTPVKMKNR